jgi:hypothetical protein
MPVVSTMNPPSIRQQPLGLFSAIRKPPRRHLYENSGVTITKLLNKVMPAKVIAAQLRIRWCIYETGN